jgi:hypothetical protein
MEIVANNGKVYKDLRAYHIALGMAVRQALINFSKEVEDYCQKLISDFYGEYNPEYYERSYQLEEKMRLGELIKMSIRGNFEGNYHLEYNLFDWQVLDSIDNGYGQFGTYMSFDKTDVRDEMEMFMQAGIIKGHEPLNLYDLVDKYVSEHLDDRIQKVLNEF